MQIWESCYHNGRNEVLLNWIEVSEPIWTDKTYDASVALDPKSLDPSKSNDYSESKWIKN